VQPDPLRAPRVREAGFGPWVREAAGPVLGQGRARTALLGVAGEQQAGALAAVGQVGVTDLDQQG